MPVVKISSNRYAAPNLWILEAKKTRKGLSYHVMTHKNSYLVFYIQRQKNTKAKDFMLLKPRANKPMSSYPQKACTIRKATLRLDNSKKIKKLVQQRLLN